MNEDVTDQGRDDTVTLERSRSQAPTHRSSNRSGASVSDEDGVPISPTEEYSENYTDGESEWTEELKPEVGRSKSASRSSESNQQHQIATRRRRREPHVRLVRRPAHARGPQPPSDESVESHDDWADPRPRRYVAAPAGAGYAYPPGYSSGYGQYPQQQQLVPFNNTPSYPYGYGGMNQPYYPPGQPMPPMGYPQMPYASPELHGQMPGYFYPPQQYQVPIAPAPLQQYQHLFAPSPARQSTPAQPETNEAVEELKKMMIEDKVDRERQKREEEDKLAKAEAEKKKAEEIAEAAKKAAADATSEAEKKAAEKAEEEAKKVAEEAAKAKAEADAALAAAKEPPTLEERKKPIKFKDAVGRKFSFPFHLCSTWTGMEDLIRQAFLHVDVIGPHVAEGHYDLIGTNGEIILPAVWETVVEPDWTITMHMWPMPEPKPEDEVPIVDVPLADGGDKKKGKGKKKAANGPPVPPTPPVPPGGEGEPSGKRKKSAGFSLWGAPKPKPKAKAAAKKA